MVVDHDLGHGVVGQERLDRAVAQDVVGDLAHQPRPVTGRQRGAGFGQRRVDRALHLLVQLLLDDFTLVQGSAELANSLGLSQRLDFGKRIVLVFLSPLLATGSGGLDPAHAAAEGSLPVRFHRLLPTAASRDRAISWSDRATRDRGLSRITGWPRLTETGTALSDGNV